MKTKSDRPEDTPEVHRRDEDIEEKTPRRREDQQILHDLRVHQIELTVQNEELHRVQAELEAARARYFDLYDLAPVGYCTLSEQGLILETNLTAANLLGVARGELFEQPFSRYILKEDAIIYHLHRKQLFESGDPQGFDLRMAKMGRTAFWGYLEMNAAQDTDGTPVCRVVLIDITERKRVEAYREMGQEVLQILNGPGDLQDSIHRVVAALKMRTGVDAAGIRLQDGDDFPYFTQKGFPEDFLLTEKTLTERSADGEMCRDIDGNVRLECTCGLVISGNTNPANPLFTRGGSFWTNDSVPLLDLPSDQDPRLHPRNQCIHQGYASVALVPIRNRARIVGLIHLNDRRKGYFALDRVELLEGIASHIGEALMRKQAERALMESEEKFALSFKTSPYSIVISNPKDGKIIEANDAFYSITGYNKDDTESSTINLWANIEDRNHIVQELQASGKAVGQEFKFKKKDGETIIGFYSANTIRLKNETYILSSINDITDRKLAEADRREMEERLSRAEKMEALGLLAGGVAHDLNNVLGIVIAFSELLLEKVEETSPLRSYAKHIMDSSDRAAAIVDDLLTMARRGVHAEAVVNLNTAIAEYQNTLEYQKLQMLYPRIRIQTDLEKSLLNVQGSPIHLSKTIMNLVLNAAEAIREEGVITIKTENVYLDRPVHGYDDFREGDYAVLSVSDTGEGITADDVKRIFEPFYTKKAMGRSGTGLGLSIVWGTVKDHNGYIDVQSVVGKGSTFVLYFPVTREDIPGKPVSVPLAEYMGHGESVLVVDDVFGQREIALALLGRLNYQVMAVSSGEEAVSHLRDHEVDLLVLDMIMDPGMDGLDTYRKILKIRPGQKAIIVSGFSASDRVRSAQALGAGAYLKKPYIKEKLGLAVRKELERTA